MNVGTLFTQSARTFSDRPAIAYGDCELTCGQADARIHQLAPVRPRDPERGKRGHPPA